jgi:hypothetical protein
VRRQRKLIKPVLEFKERRRAYMALTAMAFILIGAAVVRTMATTPMLGAGSEAEYGMVMGPAVTCDAAEASVGKSVIFGRTTCQSVPVPSGQLVGWGQVHDGPSGAWHRLAKLPDGSWLRVLTIFPAAGRSELQIYRSIDNARTWQLLSTVNDGQRLVDNGFLYVTPNGELLLSGRNNVLGESYKISQWRSTNQGHTWSREADIDTAGAGPRGVWEPYYFTLPDNRVAVMWSDETHEGHGQVLVQKISPDNGQTWGAEQVVVADGSGRPGMPAVARMTNGQYILAYEACVTHSCDTYYKRSANGVDWPGGVGDRIEGLRCGPFIMSLSDGRVVATACRVTDGNHTTPLAYSDDFGVTWKTTDPAFTDADQYGHWPALYQTSPDEIVAVSGSRLRFGNFVPR